MYSKLVCFFPGVLSAEVGGRAHVKQLLDCSICGLQDLVFSSFVSAASHSQKGSHRDRRKLIVYEEGFFD